MPLLRCTQKILQKLKVPLVDVAETPSVLGDWYANIIRLSRKQCVIFVNERTLFSFIGVQVSLKPEKIREAFLHRLNFCLIEEGFPPARVLKICQEYQDVGFAKTASRSIIGSMNDLVWLYGHTIESSGGIERCDMGEITQDMNRTPQVNYQWTYSIDEVKRLIG